MVSEIGKFLSATAKNAGLQGRVTNHSVRKICISRLLDADVPNNFVAQLSAHRSLKSLDDYKSASYEHQRRMSLALRTRPRAIPLVMIIMRKSTHGFPFVSYMSTGLRCYIQLFYLN